MEEDYSVNISASPEIEKSVIAAIMTEPELYEKATARGISNLSFTDNRHILIWKEMVSSFSKGDIPDFILLSELLKDKDIAFNGSPMLYLMEIQSLISTTASFS